MSKQDRMQKAADDISEDVYKQINAQRMDLHEALDFCRMVVEQVETQIAALEEDVRRKE